MPEDSEHGLKFVGLTGRKGMKPVGAWWEWGRDPTKVAEPGSAEVPTCWELFGVP